MKATENVNKKSAPKWLKIFLSIFIPVTLLLIYFTMWVYCTTTPFMIKTVEKRHGIELELVDVVMSHGYLPYFYKDRILKVCPEGGDREKDTFYITRKKGDFNILPNSVHDTYFGLYIREEYEEYLSDIVGQYYDDFKLYTYFSIRSYTMTDELTVDSTLQDMLKCKDKPFVAVHIYIPYGENSKDENQAKCDKIYKQMVSEGSNISLSMTVFNRGFDKYYSNINRNYFDFEGEIGVDKYYLLHESDTVKERVK